MGSSSILRLIGWAGWNKAGMWSCLVGSFLLTASKLVHAQSFLFLDLEKTHHLAQATTGVIVFSFMGLLHGVPGLPDSQTL